jgi:uncharacterized protein YndB with AHSA1/START domain
LSHAAPPSLHPPRVLGTYIIALKKDYLERMLVRCFNAGRNSRAQFLETIMNDRTNLEALANGRTRREAIIGVAIAFGGLTLGSADAWAGTEEISRTAESIHQEPIFKSSRKRVYEALTDAKQFDKVIQLSGVMQSMHLGDKPAEISREVGGAFTLFGGYITGRHVELVPNERIVQAWRTAGWAPASIRLRGSCLWSRAPEPGGRRQAGRVATVHDNFRQRWCIPVPAGTSRTIELLVRS